VDWTTFRATLWNKVDLPFAAICQATKQAVAAAVNCGHWHSAKCACKPWQLQRKIRSQTKSKTGRVSPLTNYIHWPSLPPSQIGSVFPLTNYVPHPLHQLFPFPPPRLGVFPLSPTMPSTLFGSVYLGTLTNYVHWPTIPQARSVSPLDNYIAPLANYIYCPAPM